jgi:hypothetical protein
MFVDDGRSGRNCRAPGANTGILMRKRIFLLAVLAAVGVDWLGCRLLTQRAHAEFDRWTRIMTDQGWTVHAGTVVEDGAPFGARLTVHGLTLAGGRAIVPGGFDLHAERVVLSIRLSDPFLLHIEPQGDQVVRLSSLPPTVFDADQLTASVKLWRGNGDSFDIVGAGMAGGLQHSDHHQDVRVETLRLHLTLARGVSARTTAQMTVEARGVGLPDDGRWPLGATINRLGFDVGLASPALSGLAASDQARAWRDWGGALTLQRLDLRWGPLTMDTAATLGLDDNLQPAGSGTARLVGWAATLDALARAGTISKGVAQTAKAVLGLMAPAGQSEDAGLSLPFTLRDSTLSVGKVPLMRINTLAWGPA